jgi:hypothetical protein
MTSPTPTRGPCLAWDPIWCCDLTSDGAAALTGTAVMAATEILYNRSAQQFGLCEFTVRPCRANCNDFAGWAGGWGLGGGGFWSGGFSSWPQPALIGGNWYNLTCGSCSGTCSCTPISEAYLPSPVASITQVKLNGEVLAASGYRVDDYRKLVRLGGFTWPECQDLTLADTEDNTWSVTLQVGQEVPTIGRMAVGELACMIMSSCLGEACAIPFNATSVTRQGLTIDFPTIYDLLDRKLLGLWACDLFVSTYNPRGLTTRPQVYDVDGEINRRTTWP